MNRIVVAEDDPDIRSIIESTLKFRGYQVLVARDGQQGLQLIQREVPDAAILDMDMPVMTGMEVCRRMRADPNTRHIPVIFLTAHEEMEVKEAAFEAGADDYLVKPFAPRELTMRLAAVIKRAETAQATITAAAAPPVAGPGPGIAGQVFALFGAKGGVGTSVLAANFAVALAGMGKKVCLVDLDLEHATDNMLFDLVPGTQGTLAEVASQYGAGLDWDGLAGCLLVHKSGVSILPGPMTPAQAELVTGEHVKLVLDILQSHFHYVVVDLVSSFHEINLDTFGASDRLLVVVTPELPALKAFRGVADILKQLGIPATRLQVVVNQTTPRASLSLNDVKRAVSLPVVGAIPYGGDEFTDALNRGIPLLHGRPQHSTSLAIKKLAEFLAVSTQMAGKQATR